MSIRTMTRVWEHSKQESSALLLLLALADFADDDGFCWPDEPTLAKKSRGSVRNTRRLLVKLETDQEIVRRPGSGRGHNTEYLVLSGLSAEQKEAKLSAFKTVKEDTQGIQKRTPRVKAKQPKTSTPTKQTASKNNGNRQEPSYKRNTKPQSAKASAVDSSPKLQPYALWKAWLDSVTPDGRTPPGITFTPYSRFFKSLLSSGVTAEQVGNAGELVNAWRIGLPLPTMSVIKWEVGAVTTNVRRALALCSDHVTPEEVTAFVAARYAETDRDGKRFWAGKLVTFEHMADNIGSWKAPKPKTSRMFEPFEESEDSSTWLDPKDMIA